jgi:predicted metal-dependent phosphoesterase TrpH
MKDIRKEDDPLFITGAEFSCRDSEGRYHILGYGYDPHSASILDLIEKGHSLRINKVRTRLEILKSTFGFSFPEYELKELFSNDNHGKPHIANLMVKYGFAGSKEEAIYDYLNKLKVRLGYLSPGEVISAILGAGGIPVLAHPVYGDGDQLILGDEMDLRIRRLKDFGLMGLEAFYSGFTARLTHQMLEYADRYDLLVTAGSDYHGKNKLVELGDTGLDAGRELPERLRRFIDTVSG